MKKHIKIKFIISVAVVIFACFIFTNISMASTAKIIVETANLREQANSTSKILEQISNGEEVEILEQQDNWYKVKYNKIIGYIRNDLMEIQNKIEDNTTNVTEPNDNEQVDTNISTTEETTLKKGKYKILEDAKLKIVPLINAIELEAVNKNTEVEVIEVVNNWAKIKTVDGKQGWVIREKTVNGGKFVLFGILEDTDNNVENTSAVNKNETIANTTKTMYVNSQTINVREKPNKTSKVIQQLELNTEVKVISEEDSWYKVEVNGRNGYIAVNLLSTTKQETSRSSLNNRETTTTTVNNTQDENKTVTNTNTNTSTNTNSNTNTSTNTNTDTNTDTNTNTNTNTATSSKGEEVVAYAKKFLGYKYVYGGTTPSGFDCSGFTKYVYKNFGISINRTAQAQYSNGTAVSKENLKIGDLVMFGTSASNINHVGIYMGGNMFIHAANKNRGVTTDTLASGYYKTYYIGARRVI